MYGRQNLQHSYAGEAPHIAVEFYMYKIPLGPMCYVIGANRLTDSTFSARQSTLNPILNTLSSHPSQQFGICLRFNMVRWNIIDTSCHPQATVPRHT